LFACDASQIFNISVEKSVKKTQAMALTSFWSTIFCGLHILGCADATKLFVFANKAGDPFPK